LACLSELFFFSFSLLLVGQKKKEDCEMELAAKNYPKRDLNRPLSAHGGVLSM
jgi:hypothetical protein